MTTFPLSVPRIERATSAPRLSAIVKAVRSSVRPTQSHAFSLASDHDVSSTCADGAATIAAATSSTTGPSTSAAWRSSLEDIAKEIASPNRAEARGQLLDRPFGQGVRAGEHGQDRPQTRAERSGRDARGKFGTSRGPAAGAGQAVEAVFIDIGTDRRDLGDLVSQRVGVFSPQ